ncbi:MAG: MarR family transcriptional regulator [Spirochaetaceae bacterium]|nr:MarR family transcriptional regulator [Spirochaetaceae bacterium]
MSGSNNRENQAEARYDSLLLQNQLCFPLYACAKEIVRRYKPFLDEIDLTYTQYIAMMVLWEEKSVNVKELGEKLFLDSGTLTPLLKILEKKQYVKRERSQADERVVNITITEKGLSLREKAVSIPAQMSGCMKITKEEAQTLYSLLYKILRQTGN